MIRTSSPNDYAKKNSFGSGDFPGTSTDLVGGNWLDGRKSQPGSID